MKIDIKCLPTGKLPYDNEKLLTQMMMRLFEDAPFLPLLPHIYEKDTLHNRTLGGLPWFVAKHKKVSIKDGTDEFNECMMILDNVFNKPTPDTLDMFQFESPFLEKYLQMVEHVKPKNTVINLLGPFTVSQRISKADCPQVLVDKVYRKMIVQTVCVKAMWIAGKIKEVSPETVPLILFEEPELHRFGTAKRESEELTRDVIVNMYSKLFQTLRKRGCLTGVQCFEKCDWQLVIDSGVDLISFDAYNNPNNIGIISEKINNFLLSGGFINWGIVPVKTEEQIKALTIDYLTDRFKRTIEDIATQGISLSLLYKRSLVSMQGNLHGIPLIFAEKALILTTQLAKKLSLKCQNLL